MKHIFLLFVVSVALTSCGLVPSFHSTGFHYNYPTFNKSLDYNDKKYLLNFTNNKTKELSRGEFSSGVTKFFKKKLGKNLFKASEVKDTNGKLLIPFGFNYEITDSQVAFLRQNTNLDYVILTKTLGLNQAKKEKLNSVDEKRFKLAESGAVSFIKIIDVENNKPLLEFSCSATVILQRSMLADLEAENQNSKPKFRFPIYKTSKKLREKSIKKLLKKIK